MCLAVPGQVKKIEGLMATVDIAGVQRQVCLDLVEDVEEGDYVLVHVGFALEKIDERRALETQKFLEECFREDLREGAS